jgi:hypothetical protein
MESQVGCRASYTYKQSKELSARFADFLKFADLQRVFIRQLCPQGSVQGNPGDFAALLAAVAQHCLRLVIHDHHPLKTAPETLGVLKAAQQFGKIVLDSRISHDAQLRAEHPRSK